MSRYAKVCPSSSQTGICVSGTGKLLSIKRSRSQLSFSDAAPESISGSSSRSWRTPRTGPYRCASSATSSESNATLLISASRRPSAIDRFWWRPRSNAVRAGVATGIPSTVVISSSAIRSIRINNPPAAGGVAVPPPRSARCRRPLGAVQRRSRHSGDHATAPGCQPGAERLSGRVGMAHFGVYTPPRNIGRYHRRSTVRGMPAPSASLPRNTSFMQAW